MKSLLKFFAATFILTWTFFFLASRTREPVLRRFLLYPGTFAPGMVALLLTGLETGKRGVVALLRRLVDWDVPARWYVFALGYMISIKLVAAVLIRGFTGAWPRLGPESLVVMFDATLVSTLVGGQAGEELGWRGYALPRLSARFGLGSASVILGMVWACWHLPLFFWFPEADTSGQSFPLFLLQVSAISVAMAWLYAKTRGSLLLVMLFHAAINNTKDIVPSAEAHASNPWAFSHSLVARTTVILLWFFAGLFLYRMRRASPLARAFNAATSPDFSSAPAAGPAG